MAAPHRRRFLVHTIEDATLLLAAATGQLLHAIHRPDLPFLPDQDPSGVFGDPAAPSLRVVFLGDSTVTSPGVSPLDAAWPRQVARHLAVRHHVVLLSVARGGAKARDVLAHQLERAVALAPDLAVVSVGGNDALRGTPVARFEDEYERIVRRLEAAVPAVVCSGVGDLGTIPRLPALVRGVVRVRGRSLDRAIARVLARHPRVRKTETWGPRWEPFARDPDLWAADLFHASARGHDLYAAAAIPEIDRALAARAARPAAGGGIEEPGEVRASARRGRGGSSR